MAANKCVKIYSTGMQDNINVPLFELLVNIGGTVILWLTHHLYSVVIGIYSFVVYILVRVRNICTLCVSSKICESTDKIIERIGCFTKKPQHVVVILGIESVSYKDLVKLITWCFIAEVSNISFYDHKNEINPYQLYESVSKHNKESIQRIKWGKSFDNYVKQMARKDINGYKWLPTLEVNVYSSVCFGRGILVDVAKQLCQEGKHSVDVDINTVDVRLKAQTETPDPDLVIVCGNVLSTFGYPPWELRISEIYQVCSHHGITIQDFVSILEKYANCEQRFGK